MKIFLLTAFLFCCTPAQGSPALKQDLRFLQAEIERIHPDPGVFASPEALRKAYARAEAELDQASTPEQAWRALAALNPVFADAHMFVTHADWRTEARAHVAAGQGFFPFEVQVDVAGAIAIRTTLDGKPTPMAGARIHHINGVAADKVAKDLLDLMAGDTPALRAHLLSRRFWFYYWKAFGAPAQFDLAIGRSNKRLASNAYVPVPQSEQAPSFEILNKQVALMTIPQFATADRPAFFAFCKDVFTELRAKRIAHLLIDIRDNTGGDDDLWKQGLLHYIADKPYRNGSSYIKKVLAGRQSGGEQVGDVVRAFGDTWLEPDLADPLHFSGKTYVLTGRLTYSSAILFSNVVQDFGFAQLVGPAGAARTRQSGGVQNIVLPASGLEVSIPRFLLDRPSGAREPALLSPDLLIADNPFDRRELIKRLVARLTIP